MKKYIGTGTLFGLFLSGLLMASCSGDNGHHHNESSDHQVQDQTIADQISASQTIPNVPEEVASAFDGLLDIYLQLSETLVESDAAASAANGEQFHSSAEQFLQTEMGQELRAQLEQFGSELLTQSEQISQESDVEAQRSAFEDLSIAMITLVERIGHQKEALYHQRCPMVNGGNGDWLSTQERIMNPYHGNRMLHCGSTVRML